MIEKLNSCLIPLFNDPCAPKIGIARASNSEIVNKINEIIDVVNGLEVAPDILRKDMVLKEEIMTGICSECKRIDACKDKIDARTIEDDIRYGMAVPNYIPGPNAECLVEERMTSYNETC